MLDKNGIKLRTGQIVKIEGGYFKNDNGLFRIAHSPGDENWIGSDYSLRKVKKNFEDSEARYNVSFFPLMVSIIDLFKRQIAKEHNKNATIEVVGKVKMFKVTEKFDEYSNLAPRVNYCTEKELLNYQKNYSRYRIEYIIEEY